MIQGPGRLPEIRPPTCPDRGPHSLLNQVRASAGNQLGTASAHHGYLGCALLPVDARPRRTWQRRPLTRHTLAWWTCSAR